MDTKTVNITAERTDAEALALAQLLKRGTMETEREPSADERAGMDWWNSLPESERAAYVKQKRDEYAEDVDIYKLASEMLVDDIVAGNALRAELIKRLAYAETKAHEFPARRNGVYPV